MTEPVPLYHLAGQWLGPGSIILPGNCGRVLRRWAWRHDHAIREAALEAYRDTHCPALPSRLASAFVLLSKEEANTLRGDGTRVTGFDHHCLYRVRLSAPDAPSFIADYRLVSPVGALRADWPELYWRGVDGEGNPHLRGGEGAVNVSPDGKGPYREMLTLSSLVIEERIDRDPT